MKGPTDATATFTSSTILAKEEVPFENKVPSFYFNQYKSPVIQPIMSIQI